MKSDGFGIEYKVIFVELIKEIEQKGGKFYYIFVGVLDYLFGGLGFV